MIMHKRFSEIKSTNLFTADNAGLAPIGKVVDLLVEETAWNIRYLVVATNPPLTQKVLISPAAVHEFDPQTNSIPTMLTTQQVIESPPINCDQAISREYELALVDYYGWPIYWFGRALLRPQTLQSLAPEGAAESVESNPESNLRSADEICGYQIESQDGPAGVMGDLVVHMEAWKVDFATADANSWLPKESSMFSTRWVSQLDWQARKVIVDLTRAALEPIPVESSSPPITGEPLSARPFRTA